MSLELSTRTNIKTGKAKLFNAPVTLTHKTKGYEIAGSGTRETNEGYGVLFPEARSGKWFKTLNEAETEFNRVTE